MQDAYTGSSEEELTFEKGDVIYVPANNDGDRLQGVFKGKARAHHVASHGLTRGRWAGSPRPSSRMYAHVSDCMHATLFIRFLCRPRLR